MKRTLLLLCPCFALGAARAQTAVVATPPVTQAALTPEGSAASLLRPSVARLDGTVTSLDPDKWKLSRPAREEMRRNVDSIHRDVGGTLPPLLAAADAVPTPLQSELQLLRNVDALYDVALRVAATAEIAGPPQQSTAVEQALGDLLAARRALADRVTADVAVQQKTIGELQAALRASAAPAAVVCPAAVSGSAAEKSKVKRSKPRPKPATKPTALAPTP